MPTYSFICEKCRKRFETLATIAELKKKKIHCPKCNSKKLKQNIHAFGLSTSKHVTIRK